MLLSNFDRVKNDRIHEINRELLSVDARLLKLYEELEGLEEKRRGLDKMLRETEELTYDDWRLEEY